MALVLHRVFRSAMRRSGFVSLLACLSLPVWLGLSHVSAIAQTQSAPATPGKTRARELGIRVGNLQPGVRNSITDVAGVRVGHATLISEGRYATGVTVVLPHQGNLFQEKVPAAIEVFNGFGKLVGYTQVRELGELESPIALTSTLNIHRVADGLLGYMLALPGNASVRSLNVVVGETNDSRLNDIRQRPLTSAHVLEAITNASSEAPVAEGAVGAGTGTVCFGFKGGIGTSSRITAAGHTVGVLVQTNFGGSLRIAGVPISDVLRNDQAGLRTAESSGDGSLMIVVATDAPLSARNLSRLARRSFIGMARTGGNGSNGSGDYAIAFTTAAENLVLVDNAAITPLFDAVADATEEAIYNSLFAAETITSNGATVESLPVETVLRLLREHRSLHDGLSTP